MRDESIFRTPEWRDKIRKSMYQHWGDPAERFWKQVQINGPDECWPWTGVRDRRNYGTARLRSENRCIPAHRVAYLLTYGEFDRILFVLHRCDNPPCCNPKHLFLGTHQDNMDDMSSKKRACCGEDRPQSKLTAEKVLEIRRIYAEGNISQYEVARRFGVNRSAIEKIVLRKTWAHI